MSFLHNRSASAGLSRLLSLDLASLLRGTSLLAPLGPSAVGDGDSGGNGAAAGGAGGGVFEGLIASLRVQQGGKVDVEGDVATPHSAAAAAGLMALADSKLGERGDGAGGKGGGGEAAGWPETAAEGGKRARR